MSLEDASEISRETDILISEREKQRVLNELKSGLSELKSNKVYSPSIDFQIQRILTCFIPLIRMNREDYENYVEEYKGAREKHKREIDFRCPFHQINI